tara:strand:- start:126 stop:293 length:168 start_codon:yes stop_codon:yes gene_type:complete
MISNEWFEEQDAREDIKWSAEYDRRVEEFIKNEGSNVADAQYFVMEEMLEERRLS